MLSLHKIKDLEDHKLLCGYVAMFLGEFDAAQQAFMESSQPLAALEVCIYYPVAAAVVSDPAAF